MMALWLVGSCGGKEKGEESDATQTAGRDEPIEVIPEGDFTEFDKLVDGYIRPYFDGEGTQPDKTVKAGESFDLYVVGEFSPEFTMCAAEYRLVLPEGVNVLSSVNCDSTMITMGRYDDDFSITFHCTAGPKMWLVKYICATDPSCQGGEIRVEKGAKMGFLGFSLCDGQFTLVNARPGKATLRVQ